MPAVISDCPIKGVKTADSAEEIEGKGEKKRKEKKRKNAQNNDTSPGVFTL